MDDELSAHVAYLPEIGESARCKLAEGEGLLGLFRGTRGGGVRSQGVVSCDWSVVPDRPNEFRRFLHRTLRPQAYIFT